nr:hypothetical protein [Candidatus Sigynarchaeum springense]
MSRLRKLRATWLVLLMIVGPVFHLGYLLYIFIADIIEISGYAEMSLAFPVAIITVLVVGISLLVINIRRRSARIGILILAAFSISIALLMPWTGKLFNWARLIVFSPWLVRVDTSAIWATLSITGVTLYGVSILMIVFFEARVIPNPYKKEVVLIAERSRRVRVPGTMAFIAAVVIGALLLTGNQVWYTQTYTLHYNANSAGVEYWLGAQEQYFNTNFTITSPSAQIDPGSNVTIDLSPAISALDPFFATRFQLDVNPAMLDWLLINNQRNWLMNDLYFTNPTNNYTTWYYVSSDFSELHLVSVSSLLASRLEQARLGTMPLNITCTGYRQSRLKVFQATNACMVLSGGLGISVPRNFTANTPEFNATMWLYYNWGIHVQAPHGCGIGFLTDFEMLKRELLDWQDTRAKGPWYYPAVIEGAMYDVEKIEMDAPVVGRRAQIKDYVEQTLGWTLNDAESDEHTFGEWYWGLNSMSESRYYWWLDQWNELIDDLYAGGTREGLQVPNASLRFKLVNCGMDYNMQDYVDGDPDYAMFAHNLGYGTHWAVDGYMAYRAEGEPYWTYGYVKLLSQKQKVVPHEERLIVLGCLNLDAYANTSVLDPGSRFRFDGSSTWTRDVNGDGVANGFDALMLDIMTCGASGIKRVNLWPGGGPRSTCCDYRHIPNMVPAGKDFFIEMASVLNKSMDIQFSFLPSSEHFWDKILVDVTMDLMRPKGLVLVPIVAALFIVFALVYANNLVKLDEVATRKR